MKLTNEWIHALGQQRATLLGMATTFAGVLMDGSRVAVVHVGTAASTGSASESSNASASAPDQEEEGVGGTGRGEGRPHSGAGYGVQHPTSPRAVGDTVSLAWIDGNGASSTLD